VVPGLDLNQARDRWPHFAPAALEAGFATAYAVPMRLRQDVIGALGLFHRTSGDPHDTWLAQAMADAATIGILQHRSIRRGEDLAAQLQTALTSRIAIEQAKGMLAERQRIDVDEAFTLLRADARRLQRPLPAHAADLLAGRVTISPDGEVDG
jgi:hypothetical protein